MKQGATHLLVVCYRMLNVQEWPDDQEGVQRGVQGDLARAVFVRQPLTYFDTSEGVYPSATADGIVTDTTLFRWPALPEHPYVLLLSAYAENRFQSRVTARNKIDELIGALNALRGRNTADQEVFELEVELATGTYIGTAGPINLSYGDPPDLSVEGLAETVEGIARIYQLPETTRNRVILSLRWLAKGVREDSENDAFISLWVAIETLAMPNETNVRPATQDLARIYGIDESSAASRFELGRIQGMRGGILHEGETLPTGSDLNLYLEAVYRDLLFDTLALETKRWTEALVEGREFDVSGHLQAWEQSRKRPGGG